MEVIGELQQIPPWSRDQSNGHPFGCMALSVQGDATAEPPRRKLHVPVNAVETVRPPHQERYVVHSGKG